MSIPFPIIKLEVDHMRHSVMVALTEYQVQLDQYFQEEIDRFCSPENLRRIIAEEVEKDVAEAVKNAVKSWFLYNADGQKIIKEAISKKLTEEAEYYKP